MTWDEATQRVKELGEGWRLPTIEELKETLYPNMKRIPDLKAGIYWSSSEYYANHAWIFNFSNGYALYHNNLTTYYVRAVKTFDGGAALELLLKEF